MKSGVPQGCIVGPFLFAVFSTTIWNSIRNSSCLLFADDLRIFRNIENAEDCKRLQSDIGSQKLVLGQQYELGCRKTTFISFTRKTNSVPFTYKLDFSHNVRFYRDWQPFS